MDFDSHFLFLSVRLYFRLSNLKELFYCEFSDVLSYFSTACPL
jgi:hypothetical protein